MVTSEWLSNASVHFSDGNLSGRRTCDGVVDRYVRDTDVCSGCHCTAFDKTGGTVAMKRGGVRKGAHAVF